MKKILGAVILVLIVFFILVYISVSSTDKETSTAQILNTEDMETIDFKKHDSVLVSISTLYEGSGLKDLIQGHNYREAWAEPVKIPVAFLDTLRGGLKIKEEGGGKQTHSLKLINSKGVMYTLRSVNKDPQPLVPEIAERLGLENIIIDGISGQHPFGAILSAALSEKAGVLHTHPQMLFIPKQKELGEFNERFGNKIFLLEYETESDVNWTDIKNAHEIIETDDLQELKAEYGPRLKIDRNALVRLRLFDMLIGDWDRHAEQWGWVMQQQGDNFTAIPIAGDRDNAFFNLDGVLPAILTNENVQPLVRPFQKKIEYMPGLVYPFDVYFLYNTPEEVFVEEAKSLQKSLSDKNISEAFKVWPKSIYELNGEEIKEKIQSRRDDLVEYAIQFHKIIQERGFLEKPLKGSDDLEIPQGMIKCFECDDNQNNNQ